MEPKRVTVKIDQLGRPTVEAHGFQGVGCEAATKPIEGALAGGQGVDRVLKPEWHNIATEGEEEQVRW